LKNYCLRLSRISNGFFKPLLDPDSGFASETNVVGDVSNSHPGAVGTGKAHCPPPCRCVRQVRRPQKHLALARVSANFPVLFLFIPRRQTSSKGFPGEMPTKMPNPRLGFSSDGPVLHARVPVGHAFMGSAVPGSPNCTSTTCMHKCAHVVS
jgi:hypothetical protein